MSRRTLQCRRIGKVRRLSTAIGVDEFNLAPYEIGDHTIAQFLVGQCGNECRKGALGLALRHARVSITGHFVDILRVPLTLAFR